MSSDEALAQCRNMHEEAMVAAWAEIRSATGTTTDSGRAEVHRCNKTNSKADFKQRTCANRYSDRHGTFTCSIENTAQKARDSAAWTAFLVQDQPE